MKVILDEDRLDLAKLFKGYGVEVGVAEGWYSSKIMELGSVQIMFGVDPYERHRGYMDYTRESTYNRLKAKAHERLDKYDNYNFIEDYSLNVAKDFGDGMLDFVYIDGDHSYTAVMDDIEVWLPKLKLGGIIAGDDYTRSDRDKRYYDVITAVDDYVGINKIPMLYIYHKGHTPPNWMFYKS